MRIVSTTSGSGRLTAQSVAEPTTGKDFAVARATLGISARKVATELDIAGSTLQRWEVSEDVLSASLIRRWRRALSKVALERVAELRRSGLSTSDLAGTPLGKILERYARPVK